MKVRPNPAGGGICIFRLFLRVPKAGEAGIFSIAFRLSGLAHSGHTPSKDTFSATPVGYRPQVALLYLLWRVIPIKTISIS